MAVKIIKVPRGIYGGKSKRNLYEVRKNGRHMADTTTKSEAQKIARKLRK